MWVIVRPVDSDPPIPHFTSIDHHCWALLFQSCLLSHWHLFRPKIPLYMFAWNLNSIDKQVLQSVGFILCPCLLFCGAKAIDLMVLWIVSSYCMEIVPQEQTCRPVLWHYTCALSEIFAILVPELNHLFSRTPLDSSIHSRPFKFTLTLLTTSCKFKICQ